MAVWLTPKLWLTQLKLDYRKIYLHAASSAGYYPGGAMLDMKLLFAPDGKILGAQIVGRKGVDKRIDVIATAMRDGVAAPALADTPKPIPTIDYDSIPEPREGLHHYLLLCSDQWTNKLVNTDGIVIVTSPQELVSMIVSKAVNMASLMNIRVLGLVENMSYVLCPDCGKHIDIFGAGKTDAVAAEFGFDLLARIPLDARLAALCDKGALELMENDYLTAAADKVESIG